MLKNLTTKTTREKPKIMAEFVEYFKEHGITELPKGESVGSFYEKIEDYRKLRKYFKDLNIKIK